MKILFVGDASNLHNTLAAELRRQGHRCVVASDGSQWMDTARDITLRREKGAWGTAKYVARVLSKLPLMRGYDVVELAGPMFLHLRPERLWRVFRYLKRHNHRVVLTALATDPIYWAACHDGATYRYSDYFIGDEPSPFALSDEYKARRHDDWALPEVADYNRRLLEKVDGVVACLWEYYAAYRKHAPQVPLGYAGIPIDTQAVTPRRELHKAPERITFFIGIQRERTVLKGTDRLLAAARRVCDRYPGECSLDVVENLPYADYVSRMSQAHVILDQLYSYTPATNALLGMAQGLVAVSGAEPEFYALLAENDNRPVVNVSPLKEDDIDRQLEWLVTHREQFPSLANASRAFVVKHNSAPAVAKAYLDFWNTLDNKTVTQ